MRRRRLQLGLRKRQSSHEADPLLEPRPTGVFCANDRLALGAIHAASQQGLRVPTDISFIGLDNFETAAYHTPPLTTIVQPFAEMATLAVSLLLHLLEGTTPENAQPLLRPRLIVRGTTGPAPEGQ